MPLWESISAASILAKVARDRDMIEQDALYPGYGFAKHKGYGHGVHLNATAPRPLRHSPPQLCPC